MSLLRNRTLLILIPCVFLCCFSGISIGSPYQSSADKLEASFSQIADISPLVHDAPAGKHGAVITRDEQLFFEDGTPIRFWGTGLTFSRGNPVTFPPEKHDAEQFVKQIKTFGFNLVRFVGIDNSLRPLCQFWQENGYFGGPMMDRLDYLVAMFIKHGIYYTFSINNSSLCPLDALPHSRKSAHKQPWRQYHGIRLFYPDMIEQQSNWIRSFFSHKNKYTGKTYAEDSANVYFTVVNEDSIWKIYFEKGKHLTTQDKDWLNMDFVAWQCKRNTNSLVFNENSTNCESNDSSKLSLWKSLNLLTSNDKLIITNYLGDVDARLIKSVKPRLQKLGYKGMLTSTNNWFGYGSLQTTDRFGDFVEVHGYFDHPKRHKYQKESFIKGNSFIALSDERLSQIEKKDWSFPLTKAVRSGLVGKPVIVGEWNHAAWSAYSYEGPLLLFSFSSLQDYSGIVAHTWFPYPSSRTGYDVKQDAFSVAENSVLLHLSPLLSVAWINNYLGTNLTERTYKLSSSPLDLAERIFSIRLGAVNDLSMRDGFLDKIRIQLLPNTGQGDGKVERSSSPAAREVHQTKERRVVWERSDHNGVLYFDDKLVNGVVFTGTNGIKKFNSEVNVRMNKPGAFLIVSLDRKPLRTSEDVLATFVGMPQLSSNKESDSFKFRQDEGIYSSAGEVDAILELPGLNDCKIITLKRSGSKDLQVTTQPKLTANNNCRIRIQSDNGVFIRRKGNTVTVDIGL